MDVAATEQLQGKVEPPDYRTEPGKYKHWKLSFDGPVATLTMDVAEDGGLAAGLQAEIEFVRPGRGHRTA